MNAFGRAAFALTAAGAASLGMLVPRALAEQTPLQALLSYQPLSTLDTPLAVSPPFPVAPTFGQAEVQAQATYLQELRRLQRDMPVECNGKLDQCPSGAFRSDAEQVLRSYKSSDALLRWTLDSVSNAFRSALMDPALTQSISNFDRLADFGKEQLGNALIRTFAESFGVSNRRQIPQLVLRDTSPSTGRDGEARFEGQSIWLVKGLPAQAFIAKVWHESGHAVMQASLIEKLGSEAGRAYLKEHGLSTEAEILKVNIENLYRSPPSVNPRGGSLEETELLLERDASYQAYAKQPVEQGIQIGQSFGIGLYRTIKKNGPDHKWTDGDTSVALTNVLSTIRFLLMDGISEHFDVLSRDLERNRLYAAFRPDNAGKHYCGVLNGQIKCVDPLTLGLH